VLKPPKVYFFDNGDVLGDEGARFENLVATSLLKRLYFLEDRDGYRYELRYIRIPSLLCQTLEPKKGYANRWYDQTSLRQKSNQSY
jgi:predicted AAA+ superfamily ATPase